MNSGLGTNDPDKCIDAKFTQIVYDIPDSNIGLGVKDTYFLFLTEDTGESIFGLKVIVKVKTKEKILTYETNQKGYITIPFGEKGLYKLLNKNHPDHTGTGSGLDVADLYIGNTYKSCLNYASRDRKDISYVKNLKKTSEKRTQDIFMPIKKLKIQSGDTLKSILKKEYPELKTDKNKADFIYQFNWNKFIRKSYYRFDFGLPDKVINS